MVRLEPIDDRYSIKHPMGHVSEFEIQAFLHRALLSRGKDVRGEVRWCEKAGRGISCRFDLVLFENQRPTMIIEVKDTLRGRPLKALEDTRQGRRYRLFGVPTVFIYGMRDAEEFLSAL